MIADTIMKGIQTQHGQEERDLTCTLTCITMYSKVTGGGLIVHETACKYLRISLKRVQNAVKMRVWETASAPLLAFRHGFCSELPLFCLAGVMSNLASIFKWMQKLKVSHPSLLSIKVFNQAWGWMKLFGGIA